MPFLQVKYKDETNSLNTDIPLTPTITRPNQIPLFLISDILGDGYEFADMVAELRNNEAKRKEERRDIYVYFHPLIHPNIDDASSFENMSLSTQINSMVDSILRILPNGQAPYLITGYSYGCSLAALVGEELKKRNPDAYVKLFLIDGPSPQYSKKHYSQFNLSLIDEMINILQYAAKLAYGEDCQIQVPTSAEVFAKYGNCSPENILEIFANFIEANAEKNNPNNSLLFNNYVKIILQNIKHLAQISPLSPMVKFDEIVALMTKETIEKYQTTQGGWELYTDLGKQLTIINDDLISQKHCDLLSTANIARLIPHVEEFIGSRINNKDQLNAWHELLLKIQWEQLKKEHQKAKENHIIERGFNTEQVMENQNQLLTQSFYRKNSLCIFHKNVHNAMAKVNLMNAVQNPRPPMITISNSG